MIYTTFRQWVKGRFLETGEPRKQAYSKDELALIEMGWNYGHDSGVQWQKSQTALDKKAENARELGLDYEPENTLHWHALNYRSASIQNAQAMFEALEKFVAKQEQRSVSEQLGEPVATNWSAVHEKLQLVWYRELSADEGLDEIQDLIDTTPQQRTWVGLTDEERNHARHTVTYSQLAMTAGEWAEAVQIETEKQLKEKNT
jgi:hypothetical protein